MKTKNIRNTSQFACLLLLAGACSLKAASGTWTNDASGNWGDTGNWLNGIVADGSGSNADFSTINITGDRTVTLDAAHTISKINFGDMVPDHNWILSGSYTLTLGTAPQINVANQGVTISTVIAGTAGLNKTGPGALTLGGATDTYTGGTTINGGTLTLDFSASGSPASTLIPSQTLTLRGGTLNLNGQNIGTTTQAFGNVTLNNGSDVITMIPNGAGSVSVTLGTLAQGVGGVVVFNGPHTIGAGNADVPATGTITTTTAGRGTTEYGILNAGGTAKKSWGTVGLYDWASTFLPGAGGAGTNPYTIIGGSQVTGFYTATTNGPANGNNIDFVAQQTPGTAGQQPTTVGNCDSMRFNSPQAPRGNTSGNVQTGGILVTPNMGLINADTLQIRLTQETTLIQNNTSAVFIIGSFGTSGSSFDKSGAGTLFINPTSGNGLAMNYNNGSTYTLVNNTGYNSTAVGASGSAPNPPFLNGGVTVINSTYAFACQASPVNTASGNITVNFNGGTLLSDLNNVILTNTSAANSPRNVFLGANGGGLASDAGNTLFVPGNIADYTAGVPGTLTIGLGTAPFSGSGVSAVALVPGTGNGDIGSPINPAIYATGTVDLSGGANAYTGGTILLSGTAKINGINNLGGTNYGGLTFNGGALQYAAGATGFGSPDVSSGKGITLLAGGGTVDVNGNNVSYTNAIGNGGGVLTVMDTAGGGSLTLSGASTYPGGTTVTNGTLKVGNTSGSGTGAGSVTVNNGGTLGGSGIISGNVTVNSGGHTLPGGVTNTLGGNLTYNTGASANFNLTSSAIGSGNGQIILNGASSVLTCGSVSVGINCGVILDQQHDYVLFNLTGGSASISGSFNATPVWLGTTPAGAANFSVIISGNQVLLHDSAPAIPPVISAFGASPNPVLDFQTLTISATVTAGSGTIDPNSGVTVNLSPIGGSATQPLIYDGAGHYTNSVVVGTTVVPGSYTLNVLAINSLGGAAGASTSLTVGNSATWNGADVANSSNWSDGTNWVSVLPPGFGDDVVFAGATGLAPVLDSSYNVASVTFSNNAGAFVLGNSGGSIPTIANGVTNNSSYVQTLNLPVTLGGVVTLNAASNNLVLDGVVSGGGSLNVAGSGVNTLLGANTYTGNTAINAGGTLVIGDPGDLGGGSYAGYITNNGVLNWNSSAAQNLSGILSGAGTLNLTGSAVLTLSGVNSGYSGPISINGGSAEVVLGGVGQNGSGSGLVTLTNGGTFQMNGTGSSTASGTCLNSFLVPAGTTGNLITMGNGTYSGNVTVHGTLNVSETWQKAAAGGSWANSDGQINIINNNFYLNIGGNFSFGTAAVDLGAGVYIINAGNTAPGGNTITMGELTGTGFITDNTGAAAGRSCIYVVGGRNSNATFGGTIYDTARGTGINKVGTGSWTLTGSDTYGQPTTVSAGSLIVGSGAFMANSTNITVAAGALLDVSSYNGLTLSSWQTLGGGGVITGAVTAVTGNTINAGMGAVPGTLSFSNSFAESGGNVTNNFNLSSDPTGLSLTNSQVVVAGDLTLAYQNVVAINALNGTLGAGTYTLFKYGGNLYNESGLVPVGTMLSGNLVAGGAIATNTNITLTFSNAPNAVVMIVQTSGQNLVWQGGVTGTATNNWDEGTSFDWLNGAVVTNFADSDIVTFNDSSTNLNVVVAGTVAPGSITVNSTNHYTFSGTGGIVGSAGLAKYGTNVLTIGTTNAYAGTTLISGGNIMLGNPVSHAPGTPGSGTVAFAGGNLGFNPGNTANNYTCVNNLAVTTNAIIAADDGNTYLTGNLSLGSGSTLTTGTAGNSGRNLYLDGVISGAGNLMIQPNGLTLDGYSTSTAGMVYLGAANTFAGNLTLVNGTMAFTNAGSLGGGTYAGNITNSGNLVYGSSVPQTLSGIISGSGTLTEAGNGALTLAGANSYNGATVINAGQLLGVVNGTAGLASSAVSITPASSTATFGVTVSNAGSQFTCASLTINSGGSGAILGFASTTTPSTSVAPLNVAGSLTFNATPVVTVNPANLVSGQTYPLLVCGGTAPVTVPALSIRGWIGCSLAWSGNTLELTMGTTSSIVEPLNWAVSGSGTWDANDGANLIWKDSSSPTPVNTYFLNSVDSVVFGDTYISGSPAVTLNSMVSPLNTTFANTNYNYTFSGSGGIAGAGGLTMTGTGAVTLQTANTYSGVTSIGAGTLTIGGAGYLGGGNYSAAITDNGALVFNSSAAQTLAGAVSGAGAVSQLGSGALTLTGTNTYTGNTTISAGGLVVGGSGSLNSGNYAGNILNNGAFTYQSSVGQTLGGIISGTGSNVWNSTAGLSLNNANTYSGGTFINEGSVNPGNLACFGTGPVILGAYGYSGTVTFNNGLNGTFTNALIVNPGGTRQYYTAGSPTLTWAGLITLVDGATFKFGPNGNSSQTISGGTAGNGTLDICYPQSSRNAVITVTGGAVNHVGTLENTMSGTTGTAQINAVVGPNVTNVLQNSSCPMNLTATNTYTGPTTISKGTLTVGGAGQLGGGLYAGNIDDTATNSVFNYGSSAAQTLSGIISGLGSVTVANGILTLSGADTYSGNTTISGGQLWGVVNGTASLPNSAVVVTPASGIASFGVSTPTAGSQFTCASLTINAGGTGANLAFVFTAAPSLSVAPINVAGTLTFNVTPTVTVSPANLSPNTTYPLLVCGGTAPVAVPTLVNIRGFSGSTLAWSGNTLQLTVSSASPIVEPLKWITSGTGTWDVNDSVNAIWKDSAGSPVTTYYAEPVAGSADSVVFGDTYITGNPTVTLNSTVSPTSVTFSNSIYSYTVSGSGGIAGAGSLTKNGTNMVTLTTANTYSGSTAISAGTLQLGNGAAGYDGTIGNSLNVTNNGLLVYNRFGSNTYGGVISGSGQVTKSGAGTQTLSGANTYTGNTTISAGKLALASTGSIANSGEISVGSGAQFDVSAVSGFTIGAAQTLNGSGTVIGAVTVNGTLAPTNSAVGISTLTFSNSLALAGNAVFSLDRDNSPNTNSQVVCLGTVQYGGALVLTNTGSALQNGDNFTLFSTTGYASNFGSIVGSPGAGLSYSFNPTNGVLSVVSGVNTNPTNITATVSGNVLQLSWPADHTGWRLLVQTNNLAAGVSSNTNDWTTVPGSTGINQTNITMNPALPTEFYRLVYP